MLTTSAVIGGLIAIGATELINQVSPETTTQQWLRDFSRLERTLDLAGNWSFAAGRGESRAIRFASTSVGSVADQSSLDPGRKKFAVSVVFRVPSGTDAFAGTDSPNLVQKGYYGSPGQWKIQLVANDGGRVQCRLKGERTAVMLTSSVARVASDKKWHTASCVRRSRHAILIVDGVRDPQRVTVGRIANDSPMTVSNKPSRSLSDQFRGVVDALATAKGNRALKRTLRATEG
jgi:hypothetical protein